MAKPKSIKDLIPASAAALITATNSEIIRVVGGDTLRSCVLDVLCGGNIRDSTEPLTRRRISALNLALVDLFIEGLGADPGFTGKVPQLALNAIQSRSSKAEKIVARWLLGLTDKGVQNILRDSPDDLTKYAAQYGEVCAAVVSEFERQRGELGGTIRIGKSTTPRQAQFDGLALLYLLNAVGSQTLTTRGSDKSAYGKLFEKLVLGALLSALGFKHVAPPTAADPLQPNGLKNVFWLTAQEEKRESDATLLLGPGKGVRFDLGFIGRGNPEISLDKVSRFERKRTVKPVLAGRLRLVHSPLGGCINAEPPSRPGP